MSEDVHVEEGNAEEAQPEMDPKLVGPMRLMEEAMRALKPEEKKVLKEFMTEVDESGVEDKQLELCLLIKYSPDRISNPKLLHAADSYISAVEA